MQIISEKIRDKRVKPTRAVLDYYLFEWGFEECMRVFKLTPLQMEGILFSTPHAKIGFQHIKEPEYLQGNIDLSLTDNRVLINR
jgi:hypothetical protein